MMWFFTYIGVLIVILFVSLLGGLVCHDNFLFGAWLIAIILAFIGWIIVFEEGLI